MPTTILAFRVVPPPGRHLKNPDRAVMLDRTRLLMIWMLLMLVPARRFSKPARVLRPAAEAKLLSHQSQLQCKPRISLCIEACSRA